MKKGYIWLAPLAALILFIFLYMQSRGEYEARLAIEKKARIEEQERKNREQEERNKVAIEERRLATEAKNKADAEEKALKAAEAKYLEELQYNLEFASREAARYTNVVKELNESFEKEKAAQKTAEDAIKSMRDEKKAIVEYVAKAQANEKHLKELLQKLEKLESDRLKAAAAAK